MKQPIASISIPGPCEQNWDAMTAATGGKHCSMCCKTVVDFTLMSDGQILDVFKQAMGNTPCGHFRASQLDRALADTRYRTSFVGTVAKRAAAIFLLVQSATTAIAQQKKKAPVTQLQAKKAVPAKHTGKQLTGCVMNYAGNTPVAGAHVKIKGTPFEASTTIEGTFTIGLPDSFTTASVIVESPDNENDNYTIIEETMTISDIVSGKVVMLYRYPTERMQPRMVEARLREERTYTGIAPMKVYDLPKKPSLWKRMIHSFKKKENRQ